MFGALYLVDGSADALLEVAREVTPRFEICGRGDLALDLAGLTRLLGHPHALARELRRSAAARGLHVAIAMAGTCTAARLLARHAGRVVTAAAAPIVVAPGAEAAVVAPLPLALVADIEEPSTLAPSNALPHDRTVAPSHDLLSTFRRWGLQTLGDLAALPADAVATRLGTDGLRWHRLAEGRDLRPLRPAVAEERFEQALDLEWPIEGLEPLSFVLSRLLEPLAAHLERRGRGAAVLHLRLHLVTRAVHERSLELPAPMRDARTLRTLLLLDLESHPAPAAIDRVVVAVDPTPARVLQFSLLQRPLPSPEQLSTLTARLTAVMGEGRCGSPMVADSWRPGAFEMKPFSPTPNLQAPTSTSRTPTVALRRFRQPVSARVRTNEGTPVHVAIDRRGLDGGCVERCAGPWRTSGDWWKNDPPVGGGVVGVGSCRAWDRDEWDVTLGDGATYRIHRDRATGAWFVEGIYD